MILVPAILAAVGTCVADDRRALDGMTSSCHVLK